VRGKERTRETGFFLAAIFCHLANKINWTADYPKDLSWEKRALSCHISRKNKLNLPYLDHRFLYVAST
jgi:hypothetical protein